MRTSVSNVVVVVNSSDSSRFLDFDILVEDIWRQVLAPHLTIRSDHNLVDLEGFGELPKFWQFLSYFLNFRGCVFHRKKAKVMHQILMMMSRHDLWKIMLGHYVWGQFLSDQSLNALKNRSNIVILCIYSVSQPKKRENVKKIQFLANDIMLGHLPFKWLLETGEAKTCKLDQYAYRSCWDISLRDFNQNLMEVKPEKSQI